MNNSFHRLIDGMIDAIRLEILPHTQGDYARGQAYGVIFLLKNIRLRAGWSPSFLQEQLASLKELVDALGVMDSLPADAPRPVLKPHDGLPETMEYVRDEADGQVGALIDWLGTHGSAVPPKVKAEIDAAINAHIKRQLRYEIDTSAPPMFAEMSLGRDISEMEKR